MGDSHEYHSNRGTWWRGRWLHTVRGVREILEAIDNPNDYAEVQATLIKVAAILDIQPEFMRFNQQWLGYFRNLPPGDALFSAADYADRLIDLMYNFADEHRILIN